MKTAYKLDVLCRLCLNQVGEDNIFYPHDMTKDILTTTGIKVIQNDSLPQTVCKKCVTLMTDAIHFRFISQKNDSQLKNLLFSETDYDFDSEMVQQNSISDKVSDLPKGINTHELNISKEVTIVSSSSKDMSNIKKPKTEPSPEESQLFSYECDKCLKLFSTRKKLSQHYRIHNKNCKCPLDGCEKTFACKNDLYKHIRIHTGERPYKCEICFRSFAQNGALKCHKINVHGYKQLDISQLRTKVNCKPEVKSNPVIAKMDLPTSQAESLLCKSKINENVQSTNEKASLVEVEVSPSGNLKMEPIEPEDESKNSQFLSIYLKPSEETAPECAYQSDIPVETELLIESQYLVDQTSRSSDSDANLSSLLQPIEALSNSMPT